jgi:hypothetical protein
MDIFNSSGSLFLFIVFFVPGFVSIKVHDLLIASEKRDFSKSILEALAFSSINIALLSGLIFLLFHYKAYESHPLIFSGLVLLIIFFFPALWTWIYVKIISSSWLTKHIVHPIKRPWDWFFNKRESCWVIVTLKDGRKIGGVFSDKSYASSFPLPEQIYLETIWNLNQDGRFVAPVERSKGVIILNDGISTVEFLNN